MKRFSCFYLDFCPDEHTARTGKGSKTESRADQ